MQRAVFNCPMRSPLGEASLSTDYRKPSIVHTGGESGHGVLSRSSDGVSLVASPPQTARLVSRLRPLSPPSPLPTRYGAAQIDHVPKQTH